MHSSSFQSRYDNRTGSCPPGWPVLPDG